MTVDLLVWGPTFYDIGLTGLAEAPRPGTEVWAKGLTTGAGGVATTAIAAARLGLSVTLATALGTDEFSRLAREQIERAGVALAPGLASDEERMAVTVALELDGDRAMVSHGGQGTPPLSAADVARFAVVPIAPGDQLSALAELAASGTRLIACAQWEATGRWRLDELGALPHLDVLVVNRDEALRYTGLDDPGHAVEALQRRVPRVVVTLGADGALAADATGV
ncbi:MAG: PfkB family carbohydrate kinase, partial [Microbacterium sp.]